VVVGASILSAIAIAVTTRKDTGRLSTTEIARRNTGAAESTTSWMLLGKGDHDHSTLRRRVPVMLLSMQSG